MIFKIRLKGGTGSGHHGHSGRPGKRGGSTSGSGVGSSGGVSGVIQGNYNIDNYHKNTEFVALHALESILDFDREAEPLRDIDKLAYDIQTNGLNDTLRINYSATDGTMYLAEGNHRYVALRRLGYSHAPVYVSVSYFGSQQHRKAVPKRYDFGVDLDKVRFSEDIETLGLPGTLKPSAIGIRSLPVSEYK